MSEIFAKAVAHHQSGQLAKAITLYRRVLSLKPDLAEPHNNLGAALASLGKVDDAIATYRRAIKLNPHSAEAHANLGEIYRSLGRFDAAEEMLRRAIALKPDKAEAYSVLGIVLMELVRPVEAEAAFCRAIALKPGLAGAYNNLGLLLKEVGRLAEAERVFQQAIGLAPKNTAYYDNLCTVRPCMARDAYVTALEALAENAAALPIADQIHLHFALAKAYESLDKPESTFRHWRDANRLKRQQIVYDEPGTLGIMNRLREIISRDFVAARAGCGEPAALPVFIVGMPRSGTTLIEQILASHPQVFGAGELHLLDQAADSLRDMLAGAPAFPDMMLDMSAEHFRTLGALYLDKISRRAPGARRITDKMTGNFLFAGLIHLALPNATIIHAVRDPIDTCLSCFSVHFTRGQPHTYDLAELGRYYRHYLALMAHWHRVLPPGRIIDVRYEDLVGDLEGVGRRIIAACGLEWDARCLDFHRTERTVRTASAVQVRRPLYRNSVGRWRRYEAFLEPLLAELRGSIGAS